MTERRRCECPLHNDGVIMTAASNHERVGRALGLLAGALGSFVERECELRLGDGWASSVGPGGHPASTSEVQSLLAVMADNWNTVLSRILDKGHGPFVGELIEVRNRWVHQESLFDGHAWKATATVIGSKADVSLGRTRTGVRPLDGEALCHSRSDNRTGRRP